eukprot:TRINITY_DN66791_c6_g4_i2.p1 TRINITY_DN66791_c6_g4~~TRINITY_DN66791_c6_g4_i2.p1  ORF type:complete len:457 (+),score=25.58 TRINITY_DN66791_c6_g4_i2:37-1407(+)
MSKREGSPSEDQPAAKNPKLSQQSSEDSAEEELEECEWVSEIATAVANLGSTSQYALLGSMPTPTVSFDEDSTPLKFPLKPKDAARIVSNCTEPAPVGKDDKTEVDQTIRTCNQVSSPFSVSDLPSSLLQEIASALTPQLPTVRASLHKMLVYAKGGFFKPHRDTPREGNHFGSLVILLPSAYQGGDLVVRHKGSQKVLYNGAPRGAKTTQYLAFFSDVEHEVLPVTSGYRVSLTYHLFKPDGFDAIPLAPPNNPLVSLLTKWRKCEPPEFVGFLLAHKYTPAKMNPKGLQGSDLKLYSAVSDSFDVRVMAIELRVDAMGHSDDGKGEKVQNLRRDEYDLQISELDISQRKQSLPRGWGTVGHKNMYPSRPIASPHAPYDGNGPEVVWPSFNFIARVKDMKKVDQKIQGSGNEGCDFHQTYQFGAMLIKVAEDADFDDFGEFTMEHSTREYPYCGC